MATRYDGVAYTPVARQEGSRLTDDGQELYEPHVHVNESRRGRAVGAGFVLLVLTTFVGACRPTREG